MVAENWLPYAEFIATSLCNIYNTIYLGDLIFDFSNRMAEGIPWDSVCNGARTLKRSSLDVKCANYFHLGILIVENSALVEW